MINKAAEIGPATVPWWFDWRGECVAIVGAGPSVKPEDVDTLRERIHVIAVNESYRLAPWADAVYSCDLAWWKLHKGLADFAGLKLSHDAIACNTFPGLKRVLIEQVAGNDILIDRPTYVGAGGNSGFQAMNMAVQFGATGIALLGIDCTLEKGEHWHGRHPYHMNNPAPSNVKRWREAFDGAAASLKQLGVDVVNCSAISALTKYPKLTVAQALERWQL
jgi:hypothetical protein